MTNHRDIQIPSSHAVRGEALLTNGPDPVLNLLAVIAASDYSHVLSVTQTVIAALERANPDWVGCIYCFNAHCLKEMGRHQEALNAAEQGKQRGLNLIGAWYYHDINVSARRVEIEASDLSCLQKMGPVVTPLVETYFPLTKHRRDSASESFNRSVVARKNGNREEAARFLKHAFDIAPEASERGP